MRLTNNEVGTIARAMADKRNKAAHEQIKKLKADPKLDKDAKVLLARYKSLPKFFREGNSELTFGYRERVTLNSIKQHLFKSRHASKVQTDFTSGQFDQEVRMAALDARNMAELKSKLGI